MSTSTTSASAAAATTVAAKPVYTAKALHDAATAAADKYCPDRKAAKTCGRCNGSKKMTIGITCDDGVLADMLGTKASDVVIDCVGCNGKGVSNVWHEAYESHLYCSCSAYHFPVEARDGRAVFGNTTWLCWGCGKVSQFG
jgi:hypothetical protein